MGELEGVAAWVPAVCMLPTAEKPRRVAEFDELFRAALRGLDRPQPTRLVLHLEPAAGRADAVRDLARRETECCSFFDFSVLDGGGLLVFEVEVSPAHIDVLDAIAERAGNLGS